ncbi:hypothetical protein [Priestia megaterium]|uniref:hypothetical protein n=1 Tax=Priestia megaterium TaxID=1404 RepID=UPI00112D26DB|nr:hypothetical protein [Priestia megaterium]TPF18015.1 hypothetical protein CBE78_01965 [Priestia megaterium]TPF22122.1 hypothetical protein CBE79_04470 [Priestia megaterium]
MKVIKVDNFDREMYSDVLVCENINEYYGKIVVESLNKKLSGDRSDDYFRLVEDDYKLYKFEY